MAAAKKKGAPAVPEAEPAQRLGRGRPAKTQAARKRPVFVGLDSARLDEVDALAAAEQRARSAMLGILVAEALAARAAKGGR